VTREMKRSSENSDAAAEKIQKILEKIEAAGGKETP
jgi:hypothetical protein